MFAFPSIRGISVHPQVQSQQLLLLPHHGATQRTEPPKAPRSQNIPWLEMDTYFQPGWGTESSGERRADHTLTPTASVFPMSGFAADIPICLGK